MSASKEKMMLGGEVNEYIEVLHPLMRRAKNRLTAECSESLFRQSVGLVRGTCYPHTSFGYFLSAGGMPQGAIHPPELEQFNLVRYFEAWMAEFRSTPYRYVRTVRDAAECLPSPGLVKYIVIVTKPLHDPHSISRHLAVVPHGESLPMLLARA